MRTSVRLVDAIEAVTNATNRMTEASQRLLEIQQTVVPGKQPPEEAYQLFSEGLRNLRQVFDGVAANCSAASEACLEFDTALRAGFLPPATTGAQPSTPN